MENALAHATHLANIIVGVGIVGVLHASDSIFSLEIINFVLFPFDCIVDWYELLVFVSVCPCVHYRSLLLLLQKIIFIHP